jgi:hypothetical protein
MIGKEVVNLWKSILGDFVKPVICTVRVKAVIVSSNYDESDKEIANITVLNLLHHVGHTD